MTEFKNKTDQDYLKKLSNLSKNTELNLGTFLAECILNDQRAINLYENKVEFFLNINEDSPENFVNDVSIIVSLIETLKKENLIFSHTNPKILKDKITSKSNNPDEYLALTNDKNLKMKFDNNPTHFAKWELPTTLSSYILNYVDEFCFVRPELSDYINNNFISYEEKRFKTTLFWTYIATGIAFLGLLIALFSPLFTNNTFDKSQIQEIKNTIENKEFKIDEQQFKQIIESNKIKTELKEIKSK
jgi:hypothetical protein